MKSLLLIGAGHTHVALLAHADVLRAAGFDIQLIDPGSFWYGGAPGALMAQRLGRRELCMPLRTFCADRSVGYRPDRAVGLDIRHRRLWLAGGQMLTFDTVSLDVGRDTADGALDSTGGGVRVWRASAAHELVRGAQALDEDVARYGDQRVAIAGSGARVAEIVAGLTRHPRARSLRLTWFFASTWPLPEAPAAVNRELLRLMTDRGVDCVPQTPITGLADGAVRAGHGPRFAADHLVFAGAEQAGRFTFATGLPSHAGGLYVTQRLQSPSDTRIYAVGGCASLLGRHAIRVDDSRRLARVLAHNIVAGARNRPFKRYRPSRVRAVMDLGDGSALGWTWRLPRRGARLLDTRHRRDADWLAMIAAHAHRR